MKIKIEFLKSVKKDIEAKISTLANLLDNYEATADESDISNLSSLLRYYADMIESIAID